jgi:zinc protease
MRRRHAALLAAFLAAVAGAGAGPAAAPPAAPATGDQRFQSSRQPGGFHALLKQTNDPLVSFRILFKTGAAADPEGKQGLAALTARMISDAGSRAMKYEEIIQAMYPMATSFTSQVDKEMTVFTGTTHVDNLDRYYRIVSGMLLEPGFREEDFKRVKDNTLNYIRVSLRENNEEELAKEVLYLDVYRGHPYGHLTQGTLAAVEGMTLEDVRSFHAKHYTRANLELGLVGGYSDAFLEGLRKDLEKLPAGAAAPLAIPAPNAVKGRHLTIVKKETRATAISLGFPIEVTRAHKDWIALDVARSWLGQHRNSSAHLFQRIREIRGMNYGDYAYIEYFPRGMFQFLPDPNLVRRRQIFQIWIRPVEPANSHFALRIALYELKKLVDQGMTQEAFEETRKFLHKNAALVAKTLGEMLGYALDARAYGYDDYVAFVRKGLEGLTLADVNAAIKRHLTADNVRIVMVARESEALRDAIAAEKPSPITYNAPKPQEILDEDKVIEVFPLGIPAANATIVPVEEVFAR